MASGACSATSTSVNIVIYYFVEEEDKLFWRLTALAGACVAGLEKGGRRRGKERGVALSYVSPSPPLFYTSRRARKALEMAFSWALYSGGPKLLIFQTELPILLNIVIYCGG